MPDLDEDEEKKASFGFADAKQSLGIDQPTYDGSSFASRILSNPDIPRGDVEDRRNASDTLLGKMGSEAKQMVAGMPFTARSWAAKVTDMLGITSDETRMDELKKMASRFK